MTEPPLTAQSQGSEKKSEGGEGDNKENSPAGSRQGSATSNRSNSSNKGRDGPSPVTSAKDNPAADMRNMRRIIAEDPEWSLATVPLLTDLCIHHVVDKFEYNSKIINDLLLPHKSKVLEKISTNLPLKITANLVDDEGFWKRCCKARWDICDVSAYGDCWKRLYFERNLQEIIEHFVPESTDPTILNETIPLSARYIKKLEIKQLLPPVKDAPRGLDADDISDADASESGEGPEIDHFDFGTIVPQLPYLEELHVTFGVKDCGMNFEWNLFQFTARDCLLLAKCVAQCKTLKVFRLHRSKVDDDKVRVLISHILDHPALEELDLSHNIIGDRGARAIGKFLNNHSKLTKLNCSDNSIRAAGAQAIAHALTKNTTLKFLNLRMNRLGDEGGQAVCRSLLKNSTLSEINLGSNDMTEPTAAILSQVVVQNTTITSLDLSCNRLGPDGGKQLQEGMDENQTVIQMDLRLTECGQESQYCINQILSRNQDRARNLKLNQQNINK